MPASPDDDIPPFLARAEADLGPLLGKAEPAPAKAPEPAEIPAAIAAKPVVSVPAVRQGPPTRGVYPPQWKRRPVQPHHAKGAVYPPQWKRL